MLVRDVMTAHPVTVGRAVSVGEASAEMSRRRIRHLLVTDEGVLVGVLTDRDIRSALPSAATSLSVWEINYLLARLTVGEVMTRAVITIDPERDVGVVAGGHVEPAVAV
jgi:acetoin utilization protein AcuB